MQKPEVIRCDVDVPLLPSEGQKEKALRADDQDDEQLRWEKTMKKTGEQVARRGIIDLQVS